MSTFQKEQEFFHFIAKEVRKLVSEIRFKTNIVEQKRDNDFSTEIDVAVEHRIVEEIKKRFPEDNILAEETSKDVKISDKRIWIIDPICGTNNLARGINNFCTNIALAENKKIIASCVVDYSEENFYWSIGENKVFINDTLFVPGENRYDVMIEVDFGAVVATEKEQREKHNRFLKKLITENDYYLITWNSSLAFAYTAIQKIDGFVNIYNHPWDVAASSFLIRQSGGKVTDLKGNDWNFESVGMIAAINKDLHAKLVEAFKAA